MYSRLCFILLGFQVFVWDSNAQTFIPNFSFEEWENIDTGKYIKPKNWNLEYAAKLLANGDTPRIQRSNDSKNGTYSLLVTAVPDSTGNMVGETLTLPFNFKGKPTELKGFYKLSGSAFTISLEFLVKDTLGNWVTSANGFMQFSAIPAWTEWTLPINYTINQTAQRCSLTVSFPTTAVPKNGESLWLDAFSFSNKTLDILEWDKKGTMVYPNPAKDFLLVPSSLERVTIVGLDGKSKSFTIANGQVDISSLKAGLYIVSWGGKNYKFIKE